MDTDTLEIDDLEEMDEFLTTAEEDLGIDFDSADCETGIDNW